MAPTNPPFLRATTLLLLLLTAGSALARTDIAGCVSTQVGTVLWYVPDTGEICEFVDCGGGRAPAKTTVPGCPLYEGTETVTPRFWTGFTTTTPTTTTTSVGAEVVTTGGAGPVSTGVGEGVTGTEGPAVTTMSTVAAAVSTGANGDGSLGSGSGSASSSVSSSTTSTGGAVTTAAAMRMLGAVAGVAAAGLVLA